MKKEVTPKKHKPSARGKPVSLHPLRFEEAVVNLARSVNAKEPADVGGKRKAENSGVRGK